MEDTTARLAYWLSIRDTFPKATVPPLPVVPASWCKPTAYSLQARLQLAIAQDDAATVRKLRRRLAKTD